MYTILHVSIQHVYKTESNNNWLVNTRLYILPPDYINYQVGLIALCSSLLSVVVIKHSNQKQFREENFYLAHIFS